MKPDTCFLLALLLAGPLAGNQDSLSRKPIPDGNGDSAAVVQRRADSTDRMVVRSAPSQRDSGIDRQISVTFSSKEIKTSAGAAGDISRYLGTLPSVVSALGAKFDNTLFVRGGRPSEITFLVDGIEMENINHFSQANGSGGPIGFINSDFIRSVRFYSGDIPVSYPPKISSVADIDMKGGSFSSVNSNVGVKLTGGFASVDGPALGKSGSFALAGRYVDFSTLRSIIGDEGIPRLGDLYGKLLFLPSPNLVVSATGIFSYNTYSYGYPSVEQGDDGTAHNNFIDEEERLLQGGAGLFVHYKDEFQEHRLQFGYSQRNGRSYDSLESFSDSFYVHHYARNPVSSNEDNRSHVSLNTSSKFAIDNDQSVTAGGRAHNTTYTFSASDEAINGGTCVVCQNDSPVTEQWTQLPVEKTLTIAGSELGIFASHSIRAGPFSSSVGVRADYFGLLGDVAVSPRITGMVSMAGAGGIVGGLGLYHQFPTDLPSILFDALSAQASLPADSMRNCELSLLRQAQPLRCWQATLGYHVSPGGLFVSTCELYYKWYDREYQYIAPDVQDVVYAKDDGALALRPQDGRRRVYGAEVSLVNAQRGWFSYSLGASLFDVKNQFGNAAWYNDWTNVGYTFNAAATATLLHDHTVSLSVSGSGGRPYCPEVVRTDCVGRKSALVDTTQAYYSRRLDRLLTTNARYGFSRKILGTQAELFIEIINLFNYKPVLEYVFNGTGFQAITPFGITPILGCSVSF